MTFCWQFLFLAAYIFGSQDAQETCHSSEFVCPTGRPRCIPGTWRCDGENDCTGAADEQNCPCNGHPSQFQCASGSKCIPSIQRCDNQQDCLDNSDEVNCTCNTVTHFMCTSKKQCIPRDLMCDSLEDCNDGSDETSPSPCASKKPIAARPCLQSEFKCDNGRCIDSNFRCDQTADCLDKTDEPITCGNSTKGCPEGSVSCNSTGQCVRHIYICDGLNDCHNGEDETACDTRVTHPPVVVPPSPGPCQSGNLANCGGSNLFLLFGSGSSIRLVKLSNETQVTEVAQNLDRPYTIGYDSVLSRVFFTNIFGNKVDNVNFSSVLLDTSRAVPAAPKPFVVENVGAPQHITVDWVNRLVYWADDRESRRTIQVASITGANRQVLVTLAQNARPHGIAVDPLNMYIFWTEHYPIGRIVQANLLGGEATEILSPDGGLARPYAITLDTGNRRVYFSDRQQGRLEWVAYGGGLRNILLSQRNVVTGISFFQNTIFWVTPQISQTSQATIATIRRAQTDVSRPEDTIVSIYETASHSHGLTIVHRDLQPTNIASPCTVNNGGCEGLCFAETTTKALCSCDGHAQRPFLASDQKSCSTDPGVLFPLGHNSSVAEGETLTLHCMVRTTPYFTVSKLEWVHSGRSVHGSTTVSTATQLVATLQVVDIGSAAAGKYHCEMTGMYTNLVTGAQQLVRAESTDANLVNVHIAPRTSSSSDNTTLIAVAVSLGLLVLIIIVIIVLWAKRSRKTTGAGTFDNPIYNKEDANSEVNLTKADEVAQA